MDLKSGYKVVEKISLRLCTILFSQRHYSTPKRRQLVNKISRYQSCKRVNEIHSHRNPARWDKYRNLMDADVLFLPLSHRIPFRNRRKGGQGDADERKERKKLPGDESRGRRRSLSVSGVRHGDPSRFSRGAHMAMAEEQQPSRQFEE
ncbi:hypothetical protein B296_00029114 [Ensete ventricosum]|uniref:Uncharacterized protein n=1 Tax=Ensete ventricosum TaxID=4639 RepID=A0A426Z3Y4_ENSVE|nr:hypothetical protein B296_00029114 [Ensete ventricosum]